MKDGYSMFLEISEEESDGAEQLVCADHKGRFACFAPYTCEMGSWKLCWSVFNFGVSNVDDSDYQFWILWNTYFDPTTVQYWMR